VIVACEDRISILKLNIQLSR